MLNKQNNYLSFRRIVAVISDSRKQLCHAYQKYPAALVLGGMVAGIAPAVLMSEYGFWSRLGWSLILLLPLLIVLPHRGHVAIISMLAGTGLTWLYVNTLPDDYLKILGNRDRGAEITVKIVDSSCSGKTIPWLKNPNMIKAELHTVKLNGENTVQQTSGMLALVMPRGSAPVNYGDFYVVKGVFRKPKGELQESRSDIYPECSGIAIQTEPFRTTKYGVFNFENYLLARGMVRIFYAAEALPAIPPERSNLYEKLLYGRDKVMLAVAGGIRQDELSAMLATLIFGYRQGLEPETRTAFIWSGTIHIFSVGGMHVVIMAMLLFWILRPLSFRTRHLLVPLLIGIYVVASGAEPPAVRSLLMITLWSWCRAWLYHTPTLNIVFIAGIIVLGFNPFYLLDVGVQYSFITVIFLIGSGAFMQEWVSAGTEVLKWIPPARQTFWQYYCRRKVAALGVTVASCVIAWLVSSGISLYYQGIYVPLSIIANIMIIPFVSVLFVLGILKLLLLPFSMLDNAAGWLLEQTLTLIVKICTFFYEYFESIPMIQPPLWALLIFYGAVALLIVFRGKRMFWVMLAVMATLMLSWRIQPYLSRGELILLNGGGSQEVGLVICPPGGGDAVVVNVPSWEAGQRTVNVLRRRGITGIDRLVFSGTRKDCCAGIMVLLSAFPVNQVIIDKPVAGNAFLATALKRVNPAKTAITIRESEEPVREAEFNFVAKNRNWRVEYHVTGFHITLDIEEPKPGLRPVVIRATGYQTVETTLYNSSVLEERGFVFK